MARTLVTLIVLGALALPGVAGADTITVNKTADTNNGCTPADCSLREAVAAANSGDTVRLPASATPYLVSTATISISKSITIDGDGARGTTVSGNDAHRPFTFVSGAAATTSTISDLTIRDGSGSADGPLSFTGGAIQVLPSTQAIILNVDRLYVHDNNIAITGAGTSGGGGAIGIGDSGAAGATVTVTDSTLAANLVTAAATSSSYGGAISMSSDSADTLNVVNSTLSGNESRITGTGKAHGGGISVIEGIGGDVKLNVRQSTLSANLANTGTTDSLSGGGNLQSSFGPTISVKGSIITGGDSVGTADENCKGVSAPGDNIENLDTCGVGAAGKPNTAPGLGPLQDNGGPTDTHGIAATSPAAGLALPASCTSLDQRGLSRPQLAGCDAGAFEAAPPVAVTGAASSVVQTSATLAGSVTPNLEITSYRFEYGTTSAYGSSTQAADAGRGATAVPAGAALGGLAAGTTYHYRLAATNASGTSLGADATFTTPSPAPCCAGPLALRSLRLAPSAFRAAASGPTARAAASGTVVSYALTSPGRVRFGAERPLPGRRAGAKCVKPTRANRKGKHCVRWVGVPGSFLRSGDTVTRRFRFTGRLAGKRLAPGPYRLVARPFSLTGAAGPRQLAGFRVLAPLRRKR